MQAGVFTLGNLDPGTPSIEALLQIRCMSLEVVKVVGLYVSQENCI